MNESNSLYREAQRWLPGGVNSPVRSFKGVAGKPRFIRSGQGAYLVDVDNLSYIDYVGSWGPMIVGHSHPQVVAAVKAALSLGFSFGAPTEAEVKLARKVCELMPAIEMIRFVNSGTEASMSAIRLARGFTQRKKIIKFAGCYHGHVDSLLVSAGSGGLTLGIPDSQGVPQETVDHTFVVDYNDLEAVKKIFAAHPHEIAAIIVEPIAGNMNCILPQPNFLNRLRSICDQSGALLIFDEVMTGFRVAKGGASALFEIKPDLTVLGKVIGGGFPVGAFGGRKEIMELLAPLGPVYQAGTLSGNPIAMTAGLATLALIESEENFYHHLQTKSQSLTTGLNSLAKTHGIPLVSNAVGGLFGFVFMDKVPNSEREIREGNHNLFNQFFHGMLAEGVYLPPSAYESCFMSSAHTNEDIAQTLEKAEKVFKTL